MMELERAILIIKKLRYFQLDMECMDYLQKTQKLLLAKKIYGICIEKDLFQNRKLLEQKIKDPYIWISLQEKMVVQIPKRFKLDQPIVSSKSITC